MSDKQHTNDINDDNPCKYPCNGCGNRFHKEIELETHMLICKYRNVNTQQRKCKYETIYIPKRATVTVENKSHVNTAPKPEQTVNNVNNETNNILLLEDTHEIEIIREDDFQPNLVDFTHATLADPNQPNYL